MSNLGTNGAIAFRGLRFYGLGLLSRDILSKYALIIIGDAGEKSSCVRDLAFSRWFKWF